MIFSKGRSKSKGLVHIMKLKYYMRGLGIGIVLTTLILSIGNTKEKLSDEAIIKRASALGMVMKDDSDSELKEVIEGIKPTGTNNDTTQKPNPEPTKDPSASSDPATESSESPTPGVSEDLTEEPSITPTEEAAVTPTEEPTPTPSAESTPEPTPTTEPETDGAEGGNITFTIVKGMSSGKVAAMLLEKGLIDDQEAFNDYIVEAGKADVIRIGTYTLPKSSSYAEIVRAITSR